MLAPNPHPAVAALFARPTTIDPDGTIAGYASVFGAVDQARDMVMPGAFHATLAARGLRRIPMLFQHDASEPIGIWQELREDGHGLYARGTLIPEVARSRELYALIKAGAIDGLSIGFKTVKGRIDPKTRVRKLDAVELWEISIVTFPLNAGARVLAVKQQGAAPEERLLRRYPRFSFARAKAEREWGVVCGAEAAAEAARPRRRTSWRDARG